GRAQCAASATIRAGSKCPHFISGRTGVANEIVRRAGWRHLPWLRPEKIRGKQRRTEIADAHRAGERKTVVHIAFAEAGKDVAVKCAKGVGPHVKAAVVPMAKLAVIGQRACGHRSLIDLDRVKEPATCYRITRLRDSETLEEGSGTRKADKGQIRQDPSVSQLVINHHRVATGVGVAQRAGGAAGKERVLCECRQLRAGCLIVDGISGVDCEDVMVEPYFAIGIRWKAEAYLAACDDIESGEAFEVLDWSRHGHRHDRNRWRQLGCPVFRTNW